MILLGPGSTASHEALRLLAHARTALAAAGKDGVRLCTAPPLKPDRLGLARMQARRWADADLRLAAARKMHAWRLGQILPHRRLDVLRGIEGARMKESYALRPRRVGLDRRSRRYGRAGPDAADLPNRCLNHASSAIESAAVIAAAATATIPQLGFIHEKPDQTFLLDAADLFRVSISISSAFRAAKKVQDRPADNNVERTTRRLTGRKLSEEKVIPKMIDRIKAPLEGHG